jgi:hypothetical protein
MKIYCLVFLVAGFAFSTVADETNAPANPISHDYDHAVLTKISDHWQQMMDTNLFATPPPVGQAKLEFRLFSDGRVSDIKVDSATVEERRITLCKQAILDCAPFADWPKEMRQAYTNDYRIIHFTFTFQ